MQQPRSALITSHGAFSDDGQSFIINRPDIPSPLVNVLSTGDYGVAMAQTGAGCSWGRRPAEPVTWGSGDFTRDAGGRALYLRDDKSGDVWSAGWQPLRARPQSYECLHGVGHTLITSRTQNIQSQWLVFVPHEEPLEVWRLRVKNTGKSRRTLSLWSAVEWAQARASTGTGAPFVHDKNQVLLAKARPSTAGGWGGVFFHAVNHAPRAFTLDRRSFWGPYGSAEAPEALKRGRYAAAGAGRGGAAPEEAFAGFCLPLTLKPGEEKSFLFTVGCADAQSEALMKARKFQDFTQVDNAWNRTQMFWDKYLSSLEVRSPDPTFDLLVNTWLKTQALSQDLWGGRGPRDSRVLLALEPSRVKAEVLSRASGAGASLLGDVPWPRLLADVLRETGEVRLLMEIVRGRSTLYQAGLAAVKELVASASEDAVWSAELLSDWADMIHWAVKDGTRPSKEKETARRFKAEAARRDAAVRRSFSVPRGGVSLRALEEACRRGHAEEAWGLFKALSPLASNGEAPTLFRPGSSHGGASAAGLFRAAVEGILGLKPSWEGLRVRPCLPPSWKEVEVRREFRGAIYKLRLRRQSAKPPHFNEVVLNGKKVVGDLLPVQFSRRNEGVVTVGKARP
jgi:cellobiose phosphorylase